MERSVGDTEGIKKKMENKWMEKNQEIKKTYTATSILLPTFYIKSVILNLSRILKATEKSQILLHPPTEKLRRKIMAKNFQLESNELKCAYNLYYLLLRFPVGFLVLFKVLVFSRRTETNNKHFGFVCIYFISLYCIQ